MTDAAAPDASRWNHQLGASMLDIIYLLATIAFFALMLLYVRACERLGRDTADRSEHTS